MSMPTNERSLRRAMIDQINASQPKKALKLFYGSMADGQKVSSAHTYYQAVLASFLAGQPGQAEELMDHARDLHDFEAYMEGDFLRDKANHYAKRGHYWQAHRQLDASDEQLTDASKQEANQLMRAKVILYQGDPISVEMLRILRSQVIARGGDGEQIDEQYLRNINWWYLLASAYFGEIDDNGKAASAIRHGQKIVILGTGPAETRTIVVEEGSRKRRWIAKLMLTEREAVLKLMAGLLIMKSRR